MQYGANLQWLSAFPAEAEVCLYRHHTGLERGPRTRTRTTLFGVTVDTIDSLRRGSPPLTYLKPSGRTQEVRVGSQRFSVVEVKPFLP